MVKCVLMDTCKPSVGCRAKQLWSLLVVMPDMDARQTVCKAEKLVASVPVAGSRTAVPCTACLPDCYV